MPNEMFLNDYKTFRDKINLLMKNTNNKIFIGEFNIYFEKDTNSVVISHYANKDILNENITNKIEAMLMDKIVPKKEGEKINLSKVDMDDLE